ncbi:MAG TPA: tetratricopeptide repeat protein [Methylomirabilota bacterium]|nr:tetratricopeptide repeat protein [Methylomirabilota bacterium]
MAEGIPLLEHALSASETMGFGDVQPRILGHLGEAYVLADRWRTLSNSPGRTLTLAHESGQRSEKAWALRLLGDVTARRDPPDHADGPYRDALALAEELGMRPLVAHCHLGLGKLYARMGKQQQAQEHLTTATTMYREQDMAFWLEQADAEIRESG